MALVKDEWVIRKTSSISIPAAQDYVQSQLNVKQEQPTNKDLGDRYIDNYFADIFDARDGSLYRVFAEGAALNSSVIDGVDSKNDAYYSLIYLDELAKKTELEPLAEKSEIPDLTDYRTESEISEMVNTKIKQIQIDEVIIG